MNITIDFLRKIYKPLRSNKQESKPCMYKHPRGKHSTGTPGPLVDQFHNHYWYMHLREIGYPEASKSSNDQLHSLYAF